MINAERRKRRPVMPAAAARRVVVEFPVSLLNRAEGVLPELAINRSELIRNAVELYLETFQRAKLERELAEGYIANAAQTRSLCEEFASVDGDTA
jgi:metal-responsive CopG/Arc/MetJ family transcriptional regulator